MAWNGSNGSANKAPVAKKAPCVSRGIAAGGIVAAAAVAVWFVLRPNAAVEAPKEETTAPKSKIVEVKPAVVETKPAEPEKQVIKWRGQEYPLYNEKGGKAYVTGYGVRYASPRVITNDTAMARLPYEARLFKLPSDRTIATLLSTELGTGFIGSITYDERFTKQFLKSLENPIEISADDDEYARLVKETVIATRAELKARYDNGEDIAKIINDTRDELQQLGAYRMELQKQLQELSRDATMTEKDLDDYVAAANEMLESRGCSKLSMPDFVRRSVQIRDLRRTLQNEEK